MKKIVVTNHQDFTKQQKQRLNKLGDVTHYDSLPESGGEYLKRIKGADIICSGTAGLKDAYPLSYNSEMSRKMGADIMIDNVENFINGTPTNRLT